MFSSPVLLVSQDAALVATVRAAVDLVSGCRCFTVPEIDQALEFLADSPGTLCIYHAAEANREALDWLLKDLTATNRSVATLVISDDDRPETVLDFLKRGAADCLARPVDLPRLKFLIDSLTFRGRFRSVNRPQAEAEAAGSRAPRSEDRLPAPDPPQLMQLVRKVARQDSTVLLTGETGVGKTRMARIIHELSPRQTGPFLTVNCAALPESLLESELFGHSKGSFTGADAMRTGRFAAAGKGTLLLDEVDSLPLVLQKKLLRAVDERLFEPVGSNRSQPLEARMIVATNRNLPAEIAAGTFRADLYYRLNIIEIELPPLRLRRQTIPAIAESYLKECAARNGLPTPEISAEAWDALVAFDWPGNIRELRNAIERALALCNDRTIVPADLPESVRSFRRAGAHAVERRLTIHAPSTFGDQPADERASDGDAPDELAGRPMSPLARARAEGEVDRIKRALARAGNNRTRASAELGISRVALYKKLRRYGLTGS